MDYEAQFPDFKDSRLDQYCCYCGGNRWSAHTTMDHTPSGGLLDDPENASVATVRVCKDCNRSWSRIEAYAYCSISSFISGTWKHSEQKLTKASKILKNDKKLRRRIFSELNIDAKQRIFWKPSYKLLDRFFLKQALGHLFLETGELSFHENSVVGWSIADHMAPLDFSQFLGKQNDVYPEIGSRAFLRRYTFDDELPADSFATDECGFTVIEKGNYRFRVLLRQGGKEVQSILRERIFVSVQWSLR